ncbi:MAG TPA: HD domain-containing phosphohydrolase, partial [Dermatophilaceae bacterium]|nr:HD domain-containing phosphohydrolase [Dermatophilaceae bacterium]
MDTIPRELSRADPGDGQGALFLGIVKNSADAIAVIDAQMRLVYASPSGWQLFGYEPAELLGKDLLQVVHPGDAKEVREHFRRILATSGEAPPKEFRVLTQGGLSRHVESRATNRLDDPGVRGVILMVRDISERTHLTRALRTLGGGNQALVRSTDELGLLRRMCDTVVDSGGYPLAWVGYAEDDAARTVRPVAGAGVLDYLKDLRISWADDKHGQGPTGMAIRTGMVQVAHDLRKATGFSPWRERARAHGFLTSLVLPLSKQGQIIGALSIYSDEVGAFTPQSVGLLQELADELTYGIARLRDAARLSRSLEATIGALATMSEMRDPYTAGHQCRVGALSAAVAVALGLPDDVISGIRVAGRLHDIGKIAVPAEILSRPVKLTPAEMELVKCHPRSGFDIVHGIDFPWPVAEMVLQHHERFDGSGYPLGLRGDQVLQGSR